MARARKRKTKARKRRRRRPQRRFWRWAVLFGVALALVYVGYLDFTVRKQFEGKRWAVPARVFARPLELYTGAHLRPEDLVAELEVLNYTRTSKPEHPGSYARSGSEFWLLTRPFSFWDGREPARALYLRFDGNYLTTLRDQVTRRRVELARLDPMQIGGIYPTQNEDRILVQLERVPRRLIDGLIAVEDRHFYSHPGIDLRAIARALWVNLRAGAVVQGGSTLTQQLVKNFYLTNERTLWRKVNEAIMALLLEWHYDKDEILEAYLNEVYLGQDGRRAIHGFGLAAEFYFQRPLPELRLHELALLVALVKGPSYYDPRRHPERARERRDLVLSILQEQGIIAESEAQAARARGLGVTPRPKSGVTRYPAFLDLVRRQLRRDYAEEDLTTEGLQIFTTLDPIVQEAAEAGFVGRLDLLEKRQQMESGELEGAAVVTRVGTGEVLALIGGHDPRFAGYNRAIDATRQIGSLVKPAVYLTALQQGRYTLATPLDDSPLQIETRTGLWEPKNYDRQFHGSVPLFVALANSYNVATARLAQDIGVERIVDTLRALGATRSYRAYPSLALGAIGMSPLEVAQIYQTIAARGFRTPLRAIREVLTSDGTPLSRYPIEVEQAVDPVPVYLLQRAMQEVVRMGTAQSLRHWIAPDFHVAGKTGTTDDLRDSWFAGFTGEHLAVVWVGRDDNRPAGMTGASGALQIWGEMLRRITTQPLQLQAPPGVEQVWIDVETGLRADSWCADSVELPFIEGTAPEAFAPCAGGAVPQRLQRGWDWLRQQW